MAPKPPILQPTQIRKIALTAIAADDVLFQRLVLKGGNALELVHGIGQRASFDLDFSIEGDLEEPAEIGRRIERALGDRFDAAGVLVFDFKFEPRPQTTRPGHNPAWGGYNATFKLISRERWKALGDKLDRKRVEALTTGDGQERVYSIEISKYEYCEGKTTASIDEYTIYVYTPTMIAAEKLRAICQQMKEYPQRRHPTPRPRDFYDIWAIVSERSVDLRTQPNLELLKRMFEVKQVGWDLLLNIARDTVFHATGWDQVRLATRGELNEFAFYAQFISQLAQELHALGVE